MAPADSRKTGREEQVEATDQSQKRPLVQGSWIRRI